MDTWPFVKFVVVYAGHGNVLTTHAGRSQTRPVHKSPDLQMDGNEPRASDNGFYAENGSMGKVDTCWVRLQREVPSCKVVM